MHAIKQLLHFAYQEALSCIFPVAIFATLAMTKVVHVPYIYRYDLILIICLFVQYLMVRFKLETLDEVKVITLFHLIGLGLELFKVHMGSWAYPEDAWTKIGGVPLYSGFMYASVASYICQAWRRMDLKLINWPANYITYPLAAAIYLNFFTHHYILDLRWVIASSLFIFFWKTKVEFTVNHQKYQMPMILSFFLVGLFIWFAENISTFLGAWKYPNQTKVWQMVHLSKLTSWFLLVIISIIIVANLKHLKERLEDTNTANGISLPK